MELGQDTTKPRTQALWAIQLMVLPLAKRFHHHFMTRRATNRPNKPEWFFAFVLDAIR